MACSSQVHRAVLVLQEHARRPGFPDAGRGQAIPEGIVWENHEAHKVWAHTERAASVRIWLERTYEGE